MLETFRKLWKIKDLQKKVLYTFLMLLIYRLVGVIPAPGIDVSRLNESNNFMQLPLLNMMQMMTGNAFGQMTIMAMGITPYTMPALSCSCWRLPSRPCSGCRKKKAARRRWRASPVM